MKKIWLTYCHQDNADSDVEFVAQQIQKKGFKVLLDKWTLVPGHRLWEQIATKITNPLESDGWIIYATMNSIASEACKEEYAYALDRAISSRSENYPIIGLFPTSIGQDLIPPGIRSRLYVNLSESDWLDRIASAFTMNNHISKDITPYEIKVHPFSLRGPESYAIEMRPRVGNWYPPFAAVPIGEKEKLNPVLRSGPKNQPPHGGMEVSRRSVVISDYWVMGVDAEITPTRSLFLFVDGMPTKISFGPNGASPQYTVTIKGE